MNWSIVFIIIGLAIWFFCLFRLSYSFSLYSKMSRYRQNHATFNFSRELLVVVMGIVIGFIYLIS